MFDHLSNCELRLELAEAVESRSRTIKASIMRRDRIKAITRELVERGAY